MTETKRLTVEELNNLEAHARHGEVRLVNAAGNAVDGLSQLIALAREAIAAREPDEEPQHWKNERDMLRMIHGGPVAAPPPEDQPDKIAKLVRRLIVLSSKWNPDCIFTEVATALREQAAIIRWKDTEISEMAEIARELISERDEAQAKIAQLRAARIYVETHDYSPSIFLACKVGSVVTEIELVGTNKYNELGGQLAQWLWDIEAHNN